MDTDLQKQRMAEGKLYLPNGESIMKEQLDCMEKLYDYNNTRPHDFEKRAALLKEMFAEIGEGCYIEPPLHANWAGKHVHFGKEVYANFNLTLVDDGNIFVGDNTMFAPNVLLLQPATPFFRLCAKKVFNITLMFTSGKMSGWVPEFL